MCIHGCRNLSLSLIIADGKEGVEKEEAETFERVVCIEG